MKRRPAVSVFLISGRTACRADLASAESAEPINFDLMEVEQGASLVAVLETLLRRGGIPGRRALVFSNDIWLHIIRLPGAGLLGLAPDEIRQALQFEVESLTGISSEEMALAFRRLPDAAGDARFWVSVASRTLTTAVFQSLQVSGARSVWLAHPAGAARGASMGPAVAHRYEFWPSAIVDFGATGDELQAIIQGAAAVQKWRDEPALNEPESMADAAPQPSVLWGPGGESPPPQLEAQGVTNLAAGPQPIKAWVAAAAQADPAAYPRWTKSRAQPAGRRRAITGITAAVLAGAAVWLHWNWLDDRGQTLLTAIAERQQLNAAEEASNVEWTRLAEERALLLSEAETVDDQLQLLKYFLDHQVGRLDKLLTWLLQLRTEDLLIRELKPHERGLSIIGMSLNSESAPQLANHLRDLALPLGWRVNLSAQIGAKTLVSGGPWEFEIVLEDAGSRSPAGVWIEAQRRAARVARDPRGKGDVYAP